MCCPIRFIRTRSPPWAGLTCADILEAMEGLTPMYRAVFNLYAIEEYGHRELRRNSGFPRARRNRITPARCTCGRPCVEN